MAKVNRPEARNDGGSDLERENAVLSVLGSSVHRYRGLFVSYWMGWEDYV